MWSCFELFAFMFSQQYTVMRISYCVLSIDGVIDDYFILNEIHSTVCINIHTVKEAMRWKEAIQPL